MGRPSTALVLGGGCAGIAAAVRLAERGVAVTLLETRKRLGGRATSHLDPDTGELIDNCQHVVLGCCTNILDLYQRLGVVDQIVWHDQMYFANKHGRAWTFAADRLPAPLHLARALLGYKGLKFIDRINVARVMGRIMRAKRETFESQVFGAFLASCRASQASIDYFWNPIVRGACNLAVNHVAASSAMQVFQQGFMANTGGWRMGVSKLPLAKLYDRVPSVVESAGGVVRCGVAVDKLITDHDRVVGINTTRGQGLQADVVISALPQNRLAKVAPPMLRDAARHLAGLERIGTSPIIGMHLWLDRPVLRRSHLFFTDASIDWLFDPGDAPDGQQHLHTGISAAADWVGMTNEQLLAMAMDELRQLAEVLSGADEAQLVRGQVIREKRATIAPLPGLEQHRPQAAGPRSNLLVAGDWTDTGWPSTMEGAVRSGYAAAGAALGEDLLIEELTPGRLSAMLGGLFTIEGRQGS